MKKTTLLCAFAAAACLSLGGAVTLAAGAEGNLSVGSMAGYYGATVKGTQDGKTLLSGFRTEANSYAQGIVDITGYNNESVSIKFTPVQSGTVSISILSTTTWWHVNGVGQFYAPAAVTAGEQVVIQTDSLNTEYSGLQMYVYLESATATTEQSIIIDEIRFGDVSYTPAEYTGEAEVTDYLFGDYTKWTGSSNVAIEANDVEIQDEDGVKEGIGTVRFTSLTADGGDVYVSVPIEGVAASWSNLYVKFAASSGIQLIEAFINEISDGGCICVGVNGGAWNTSLAAAKPDGYTLSTMSVGSYVDTAASKTALIFRITFAEGAVAADEYIRFSGMAFGAMTPDFATDSHELIVGDMTASVRFTVAKTDAGTEVSYPLKEGTDYNVVQIPVTNWTNAARYLKLTFVSEKDFQMAVYYGFSDVLSPISSYSAGVEYTVYADTAKSASATAGIISFNLYIDAWGDSLANTILFTGVEMTEVPGASLLGVNYETETLVFDDYIEVFATKGEDGTLSDQLVSGETAVIPGTTVFFRGKATDSVGATEASEYALPARPEISALTPVVTDTSIAFSEEGYSFKLGDGEWTADGTFTDLTANTEYTVTIKRNASDAEFASEELSFTVTTAETEESPSPVTPDDSGSASSDGSGSVSGVTSVSGGCGSLAVSGALFAFAALSGAILLGSRKRKDD